jgi:hypothetical protein
MAWVPWLLAAVDGLVRARTPAFAAAVAVSAALAFLAGYAQGTVYAVQLAAAYGVLATFLWAPRGTRGRVARLALLAAALAVGLVAAQLLPTLELVSRGVRGLGGLTLAQAGYGSLEPAALLSPWVLGDPGTWRGVSWITWRAASVPLVALPLAVAALAGRPWRALGLFFVLVAGLAGLLMLGPQAWVYRAYHTLPLGGLFRVPVRFDFVYAFAVALLIGLGAQTVQEAVARRRGVRAGTAVALLLAAAVGGERWARSRLPFTHPAIADPASYESRAFAELLREDPERRRGFVVEGQMLTWKLGTRHGVPVVPDYDAVLPSEYERYFTGGSGGGYHPWHGDLRLAGPPWEFGRPGRPPADVVRLLDLMSVGLYAIDPTTPAPWRRDIEALLGGASRRLGRGHVVTRPEALPRAYVVHDAVVEPDRDRALGILLDPAFDARRRAVVERAPAALAASAAPEPVRLVDESPTGLTVSATCAAPCLLVTTDLSYPGWRATVDGRRTEIVTANVLYRGVPLGPGAHEIVFRYRPGSFFVGATVSFASIGVLIWMLSRRARV